MPTKIDAYGNPYTAEDNWYVPALLKGTGLGSAPSGYGDEYDQLFAANPYRNLTYHQTGWQRFLSKLGIRTDYDRWLEDAQVNAAEYDAGIYSQMQQNRYNSPEEQAMRMRAAGENPDLLGTGDVASAATPADDPNGMSPTDGQTFQPLQFVGQVTQGILDLIPQTLSFCSNLQQLKGIRTDNDLKELQFDNQVLDSVTKFFANTITPEKYRDAFQKGDFTEILESAYADASYLSGNLLSTPRARRKFQMSYGMYARSMAAKIQEYKSYDEFEKNRKSLLSQRVSSFFNDDDETMMSLLSAFLQPIEQFQKTMNDINLKYSVKAQNLNLGEDRAVLENTQIANQQAYESAIDPSMQAESENAANRRAKMQEEIQAATETLFATLDAKLGEHDNWWSKIAMALIGIARAQVMSGMHMQFGRQNHLTSTH